MYNTETTRDDLYVTALETSLNAVAIAKQSTANRAVMRNLTAVHRFLLQPNALDLIALNVETQTVQFVGSLFMIAWQHLNFHVRHFQ